MSNFFIHVLGLTAIYAVWGLAHGDAMRRLGLLSLAGALVAGAGAYGFAIAHRTGSGDLAAGVIGVVAGALAGALLALVSRRTRGHDYVLATFAIMIIWEGAVATLREITGGAFGIARLPSIMFAEDLGAPTAFALQATLLLILAGFLIALSRRARLDVAFALTRRSVALARSFDVPVSGLLALHGTVAGALSGAAGVLYVAYVGFVGPTSLALPVSITIAALALAAARGWLVFSAVLLLLTGGPELLRLVGASGALAAQIKLGVAGAALVLMALLVRGRDEIESNRHVD